MASIKQRRESLSDEDICAAAAFKLRGDAQTYFQLNEAVIENYSLGSFAKILRRRFDSNRCLREQYVTCGDPSKALEIATAFEMQWKLDQVVMWCRDTIVTNDIVVSSLGSRIGRMFRQ